LPFCFCLRGAAQAEFPTFEPAATPPVKLL
jgi:hypothetical protein